MKNVSIRVVVFTSIVSISLISCQKQESPATQSRKVANTPGHTQVVTQKRFGAAAQLGTFWSKQEFADSESQKAVESVFELAKSVASSRGKFTDIESYADSVLRSPHVASNPMARLNIYNILAQVADDYSDLPRAVYYYNKVVSVQFDPTPPENVRMAKASVLNVLVISYLREGKTDSARLSAEKLIDKFSDVSGSMPQFGTDKIGYFAASGVRALSESYLAAGDYNEANTFLKSVLAAHQSDYISDVATGYLMIDADALGDSRVVQNCLVTLRRNSAIHPEWKDTGYFLKLWNNRRQLNHLEGRK